MYPRYTEGLFKLYLRYTKGLLHLYPKNALSLPKRFFYKSKIEPKGLFKFWNWNARKKNPLTIEALRCSHPQVGLTPSGVPFLYKSLILKGCMAEESLIYIKTGFYPRLKTRKGIDPSFHSTFLVLTR